MRKGLEESIKNWEDRAQSLDLQIESLATECPWCGNECPDRYKPEGCWYPDCPDEPHSDDAGEA